MNPSSGELNPIAGKAISLSALQWVQGNCKQETQEGESIPRPGHAERTMRHIPVREFMSRAFTAIDASTSISDAVQEMQAAASPYLLVLDGARPRAIVTEGDMLKILTKVLATDSSADHPIITFCEEPPLPLKEKDSLYVAAERSRDRRCAYLPIVDAGGRAVGVLSREAIVQAQLHAVEKERDAIERQVYNRSRELSEVNRELQALALQDGLLKIGNRRAMESDLHSTHMNALRYGHSYALALVDVDFFKRYNDHYGHCAGDRALITVADCMKESIRRGDRVYRYGGEELLILMPETCLEEAMEAAWRLANKLYNLNVLHQRSPHRRLTISAGVSAYSHASGESTWQTVLEEADSYLYQAKSSGRNQVCGQSQVSQVSVKHT